MVTLSKSEYCGLWQCPKLAWLSKNKPEEKVLDESVLSRMEAGTAIGNLAKGLFGEYTDISAMAGEERNFDRMADLTKEAMAQNTPVICEASFARNGLSCAVDILRREGDGWAIYEVKSSSKHSKDKEKDEKPVYIADIAFQKYVLEKCDVCVTGTYLVCINGDYVLEGELDIEGLFVISEVTEAVNAAQERIASDLSLAEQVLGSHDEPDTDLSLACNDPYPCAFWPYCARHLPTPSVFDLYRLRSDRKFDYYRSGVITFKDLAASRDFKNKLQLRQIDFALHDRGDYIEKENIRDFLCQLSYPLYFLDFETMQPAVPEFQSTHPYAQIPFQYSLHYIECEGGELQHKEFLAVSGTDPRRALAEQLCADIPMDVCTTAYNKAFECTRLEELAVTFPDLAHHLRNIKDHITDLLVPFQSGYYYNRAMGGSFSIKSVLPALFPDDPSLDYHSLEEVHNGSEAMTVFPKIQFMPPEEQEKARYNLLKYCELDTYAMVKVWEKLVEAAEE